MANFSENERSLFPIQNIEQLYKFIEIHLEYNDEPNLALLSLIIGCVENSLTCHRKVAQDQNKLPSKSETVFPSLELNKVEALYQRFVTYVKASVDSTHECGMDTSRESVKRISDVIWAGLTSNYTDKAHLQSLYTYLTGNKLDCFGVSLAVVAACQILGYKDVHLSLSEDHAWVVFGPESRESAEVTWHGKGVEDRRGQPIKVGGAAKSWLYLDGQAVVCNRHMEFAAMVSGINPAISATTDSTEMARLQQRLLWMLYDMGHLDRYPMALGNLGDLEDVEPTDGRPYCEEIYKQAVSVARHYYNNQHVYPYTYIGAFYYRHGRYKQALKNWAEAADVISHYNYSRDDEEIYKEFLEIAHDLIPQIIRFAADGYLVGSIHHKTAKVLDDLGSKEEKPIRILAIEDHEAIPFLKDPENYELILRFYDGICEWEEGSSTPVLHITWAKHFTFSLSKFDGTMRNTIQVVREPDEEDSTKDDSESDSDSEVDNREDENDQKRPESRSHNGNGVEKKAEAFLGLTDSTNNRETDTVSNNNVISEGDPIKQELNTKVEAEEDVDSNMADLAKDCADYILNPDFLLGRGEPFAASGQSNVVSTVTQAHSQVKKKLVTEEDLLQHPKSSPFLSSTTSPGLQFRSAKMKGLKGLLTSERLNTSAINLQLTAQSQVSLKHSKVSSTYDQVVPRKRTRRSEPV